MKDYFSHTLSTDTEALRGFKLSKYWVKSNKKEHTRKWVAPNLTHMWTKEKKNPLSRLLHIKQIIENTLCHNY
jgi:hypothetical protein